MLRAAIFAGVFAVLLGWSGAAAAALTWLGVPDERAQVQDTWRMNDICRRKYSQADSIRQQNRDFALRAVDTIFTVDQRSFDQRTGTLSEPNKYNYPGAVIMKPKGDSSFPGRKKEASPLCVSGKTLYQTNPRLR
jgi:hypothetical protein